MYKEKYKINEIIKESKEKKIFHNNDHNQIFNSVKKYILSLVKPQRIHTLLNSSYIRKQDN